MIFNVTETLEKVPVFFCEYVSLPKNGIIADEKAKVYVSGTIQNLNSCFLFEAKAEANITFCCCRCLKLCNQSLSFNICEKFSKLSNSKIQQNQEELEENEFFVSDNDTINLMPAVEANLLVNLPMTVLCNENCKGLCPICGQNLNETSCNCKITDERFAILRSLTFVDNENNEEV